VKPVYISGAGIISPLGSGLAATEDTLRENRSAIKPLDLFSLLQGNPLPVGQVNDLQESSSLPRTHQLAHIAATQAMQGVNQSLDAIILGTTTGGILTTEELLKRNEQHKELYKYHGLHSVADYLAQELHCSGPALVVSTACSSGAVAISIALEMLRSGQVETVLAGGVDSLCRLTYFGFNSLQLVDHSGCKPLDLSRQGMAVAEGAAMLLLTTQQPESSRQVELLGAGLSCDAYHPAAPHPEGQGAFAAMEKALADAGLGPEDINYISLHGTGTQENDLAESKAVRRLFPTLPLLSSIKGASGHSLAASGAIEAVVSMIIVSRNLMPANTGLQKIDPLLGLTPLNTPLHQSVRAVVSNSFGFGGNNGSLVIGSSDIFSSPLPREELPVLAIHGYSCLSGVGDMAATKCRLDNGSPVAGMTGMDTISENLPPRLVRRLKRLPRMTLSLAVQARENSGPDAQEPGSVFMGTGWGALSETYDFWARLTDSDEQFPSPTDFVGSVHNGPASQVAILFKATGPNITTSGGDYSFEQALLAAQLMYADSAESAIIIGADEGHDIFSPLFDPSISPGSDLADGGAAFCVNRKKQGARCCIAMPFYQRNMADNVVDKLVASLGGAAAITGRCPLILAGIPAAMHREGEKQLEQFMERSKLSVPVIRYREFTGEFASASALAAAFAVSFLETGVVPGTLVEGDDIVLDKQMRTILVLGFGQYLTVMEFFRP
jgi:3-oxoacyl-(acyl-carrier-protein) synthase